MKLSLWVCGARENSVGESVVGVSSTGVGGIGAGSTGVSSAGVAGVVGGLVGLAGRRGRKDRPHREHALIGPDPPGARQVLDDADPAAAQRGPRSVRGTGTGRAS